MIENRKELLAARRNAKPWQADFLSRYGPVNRYAKYVAGIESPDMTSRIIVEIPSYDDPDTVNTMRSALATAASPFRISFGICFQSDNMEMLQEIQAFDRCCVKHYAKADAPGACRARYDCQDLLGNEDFVMHVDAHMRFAPGWDIFFIDQWHECGHDKAVMSGPGKNLSPDMMARPFDDPFFVESCSWCPLLLVPDHFHDSPCQLVVGAEWRAESAGKVLPGAFMSAGAVFACASFDREVRVDPYMNFTGDEEPVVIRAWEKGFRFFHPSMMTMFHRHDINRHNASYHVGADIGLQAQQNLRYEALLGLRNDVDLGEYGLSDIENLREYERYAGICFKTMSITDDAAHGRYGVGRWSAASYADVSLAESRNANGTVIVPPADPRFSEMPFSGLSADMVVTDRDAAVRTLLARDMSRLPDARYLGFVSNIPSFDLMSEILVEIPAYCDPETVPTVMSAFMNAANPGRVHFAVYLQDDDASKLDALDKIPNCRVAHVSPADAPGLCAARYECHKMRDHEEFVLRIDSHMRFARYWDIALLFSWLQCRDPRAIVTDYAAPLSTDELEMPLDDDHFISKVEMFGRFVVPYFFFDGMCDLRFQTNGFVLPLKPGRGAFIGGHFVFGRAEIDIEVPSDPMMDFSADEDTMAARYWTHGFNLYQCSPRYIYHLYNREAKYGKAVKSGDSGNARRKRQLRRMEVLLGIREDPGVNLFGFGLGTVRSLAEYEAYAGIDFRKQLIRKFAAEGRFEGDHTADDMRPVDWYAQFQKDFGYDACRGETLDIPVLPDTLSAFNAFCKESGYRPEAALRAAILDFIERQRRYGR